MMYGFAPISLRRLLVALQYGQKLLENTAGNLSDRSLIGFSKVPSHTDGVVVNDLLCFALCGHDGVWRRWACTEESTDDGGNGGQLVVV